MTEERLDDKFIVRIIIDLNDLTAELILEELREVIGRRVTLALHSMLEELDPDARPRTRAHDRLDLCYVTYEGKTPENGEYEEGWGLTEEQLMDRIPGDTLQEKQDYIRSTMEGVDPEEL